jgi:beta-1,4-N-acetylglucosaminyltransferase
MKPATRRADVLLVTMPGGHLLQLLTLRDAWEPFSRLWVTLAASDAESLLEGERVVVGHGPAYRNVKNLLRNLVLAWRVIGEARPKVVVASAAVGVPFAWIGRLRGARVVYVESFTRIEGASLSARLVAPIADRVYVQWPELAGRLRHTRYAGNVLGDG